MSDSTHYLDFNGISDTIVIPSSPTMDDIPLHDFCMEFVGNDLMFPDGQYIFKKGDPTDPNDSGLVIYGAITSDLGLSVYVMMSDEIYVLATFPVQSSGWHHYEIDWDESLKTFYVFIDGIDVVTTRTNYVSGSYVTDQGFDATILSGWFDGEQWFTKGQLRYFKISSVLHHISDFNPPSLTVCPDSDANTILRLALDESSGTIATDSSGNGNNGTIYGGSWVTDPPQGNSILETIKQLLGIPASDKGFDTDIIVHINTSFMFLNQMGVGPEIPFRISDSSATWEDFTEDSKLYDGAQTFVFLQVKMSFDPAANSFTQTALKAQSDEIAWRLTSNYDMSHPRPPIIDVPEEP